MEDKKYYLVFTVKECDTFIEAFETLEEANNYAWKDWHHLTQWERDKNTVYVAHTLKNEKYYDTENLESGEDFDPATPIEWFCGVDGYFDSEEVDQ